MSVKLNDRQRKKIAAANRRKRNGGPTDARQISSEVSVVPEYKDQRKKVYASGLKEAKERIARKKATFDLPEKVEMALQPLSRWLNRKRTSCILMNRDGKERELLPDKKGDHRILVHGCVARKMVSKVCMLVRITKNEDDNGNVIDGSWAIVPAEYRMINATTIQHVRKRRWWWLHRYWYEISFDGRVQPAHLLFDYGLNPAEKRRKMYITHEFVKVRKMDKENDYFRIWSRRNRDKQDNNNG